MKKVILLTCIVLSSCFLNTFLHSTKEYLPVEIAAYHYAKNQHFSKDKIYQLLINPSAHGFSKEMSREVINNLDADYKKNALIQGQYFSDALFYSKKRIYVELTSPKKENFSKEEAQYALNNLQADYFDNALHTTYFYLNQGYRLDEIKKLLKDPYQGGFTEEEVCYALSHY